MRIAPIVFAASLVLAVPTAQAQSPCGHRNALVADLGLHVVAIGYARTFGCYVSVQASAGLYVPWTVNLNIAGLAGRRYDDDADVAGLMVRVRPFIHPLGHAPGGLWVSPYVQAGPVGSSHAGGGLKGVGVAAGLSVGWNFLLGARWLVGLGLGAQWHFVTFDGGSGFPGFVGFWPTVDLHVAWRF